MAPASPDRADVSAPLSAAPSDPVPSSWQLAIEATINKTNKSPRIASLFFDSQLFFISISISFGYYKKRSQHDSSLRNDTISVLTAYKKGMEITLQKCKLQEMPSAMMTSLWAFLMTTRLRPRLTISSCSHLLRMRLTL